MRCGIQARALQFLSRRFGKGHCNAHPSEDYRENSNRSCNDFKQPVERIFGGLVADLATIAAEALHFVRSPPSAAPCKAHGAYRRTRSTAAGTGNPRNGERNARMTVTQRALGHCARNGPADRAVLCDDFGGYAKQFSFGCVGISDKAALEPGAAAGNVCDGGGDYAAGA